MPTVQGSITIKRRPKDGEPGKDAHSPYIGTDGYWYYWDDALGSYVKSNDKAAGVPGIQGPVPIQKEWVQGDTHKYNDEIRDYLYVRGSTQDTSYWYTLINKGTVTAGAPPTGGAVPSGYQAVSYLGVAAAKVLIGEEANLANFIFKQGKLFSESGTSGLSGIEGTNKDLPAYWAGGTYAEALSGTAKAIIRHDGTVKFTSAEITGTVNAISGTFNNVIFQSGHIGGFRVSGTGLTNGPDFNNDAYIIFRNDENKTFAGIGGNVLPSSSGLTAVARFENGATNNFYGSTNYGVIIEASGASRNIGISLVGDIVMKGALVSIEPTFQSTGYTDSIIVNISKYRRFLFTPGTSQYLSVDLPSSSQIVNAFGSYKLPTYWNIEIEIEVAWNASGSIALRGSSGSIFVNNNGDVVNHEDTYAYGIIKMKKGDVVTVRYNSYHGRWQLINHSY